MEFLKRIFFLIFIYIKSFFIYLFSLLKYIFSYILFLYYQKNFYNNIIIKIVLNFYNNLIQFNLYLFLQSKYLFLKTKINILIIFIKKLNLKTIFLLLKKLYKNLYNFQKQKKNFKEFFHEKELLIKKNNFFFIIYYFYLIKFKLIFKIINNKQLLYLIKLFVIYIRFYCIYGKYYYINQISYNYTNLQFYSNYNYSFLRFFYTWFVDSFEYIFSGYYYTKIKIFLNYQLPRNQFLIKLFFQRLWFFIMFLFFYFYMLLNIIFNYNLFIKNPVDSNMPKYRDTDSKFSWVIFALLKPLQFFIRPFFRYIPTYRLVFLNFLVLNKLFIHFIFKDLLNLINFFKNKFIKIIFFIYNFNKKSYQILKNIYYYFGIILIIDGFIWSYKQMLLFLFKFYLNFFYFIFQLNPINIYEIFIFKIYNFFKLPLTWLNFLFYISIIYKYFFNIVFIKNIIKYFFISILFIIYNFILVFFIFVFFLDFIFFLKILLIIVFIFYYLKYILIIRALSQLYYFSSFFIFFNQKTIYFCIKNNLNNCLNQLIQVNNFSKNIYKYFNLISDFKMESINVEYLKVFDFDDVNKLENRYKNLNFLKNLNKNELINNKFTLSNKIRKLNLLFIVDLFSLVFYLLRDDKIFFKDSKNFKFYYQRLYDLYYKNYKILTLNRCNKFLQFNNNIEELDYLFLNYKNVNYSKFLKLIMLNKFNLNYIYFIIFFNKLLKEKEEYTVIKKKIIR